MRFDDKKKYLKVTILVACLSTLCISCSAGFDNSRIRSLNIEARRYFDEGEQFRREGKTDEAIASYTLSIEAGPSAAAYNGRAAGYNRKGRYDDAITDANRAIMLNDKYALPYFNRGNAYYSRGDYGRALKDYSRSLILDPGQAHCYFNLAQTYARMGLDDEAIDMYGKAAEADPSYYAAPFNRARLYAQKKDAERALNSLEQAVEAGLCNPARLRDDKSFDAIRKTARFKRLEDRLNKKFRGPRGSEKPIAD